MGLDFGLPEVVDPPDSVCFQINVPNDPAYISAFFGAMLELTKWVNWERDPTKTATLAATRMRSVYEQISVNNCPASSSGGGTDDGSDFMIRQNPDNPCLLESSVDGIKWCVWADLSKCTPNPAPGAGVPPPPAQQCQGYDLKLDARAITILPFVVNSGDTLVLDSATGAGTDTYTQWYCPDGELYVLGGCAGGAFTSPTDPVPSKPHMSLIVKIGTSYYHLSSTAFTVPGGVVNQPIYIQTNTNLVSASSGNYQAHLTFCNNTTPPAAPWCRLFDLTTSPFAFTFPYITGTLVCGSTYNGSLGSFASGVGLSGQSLEAVDCAHTYAYLVTQLDLGSAAAFTIVVDGTSSANSGVGANGFVIQASNDPSFASAATLNSTGVTGGTFSRTGVTATPYRYVRISAVAGAASAEANGSVSLNSVQFNGTGVNPFGSSNC